MWCAKEEGVEEKKRKKGKERTKRKEISYS
jgi:hypothetical protein